jgi:hypothetical protein
MHVLHQAAILVVWYFHYASVEATKEIVLTMTEVLQLMVAAALIRISAAGAAADGCCKLDEAALFADGVELTFRTVLLKLLTASAMD